MSCKRKGVLVASQNEKKKNLTKNADRRNIWLLIVTTLLVIASVFAFVPPSQRINQGLDIQGGLSVVLTASNEDGSAISDESMEKSRAIVENRVNMLGATEATVQVQGEDQILVQIPGVTDPEQALRTIGTTGKLEFARLDSFTDEEVRNQIDTGAYEYVTYTDELTGQTFTDAAKSNIVCPAGTYTPLITGENISRVQIDRASEASQYYAVDLSLDSAGSNAFAQATQELYPTRGKIVILLDGVVQSAPAVQSEITGGQVSITGNYSMDEAKSLQTILESGSLPISFSYSQSQVVGPTLGQDALASGVLVALIGLVLVMLYLFFFYKGLGFITAAAMIVFSVLYLGLLALLSALGQFSLSLAGVAGIVLTIGMAADSSILTLERFREEIRMGRSVKAASQSGVQHAIMTSIDADLVTLVSALTLFFLAAASVKGFGLTLALGIFCDIAMMLLFKAPLIRLMAPRVIAKNPGFWDIKDCQNAVGGVEQIVEDEAKTPAQKVVGRFIKRDIPFMRVRKVLLIVAAVCVVLSTAVGLVRGLNFGTEFVGGTSISISQTQGATTDDIRDAFAKAGQDNAVVQTTSTNGSDGFLVRLSTTDTTEAYSVSASVAKSLGLSTNDITVSTIQASWGASVIRSSLIAFFVSLLLIIAYIAIRFRSYKMGVVAVVTLLHDLIIVVGVYALLGREFTPNTVAALLTILGYSLYDTVVVFHRVNDNMKAGTTKATFMSMANHSINQVFIRSINTTLTSLIPVLFMMLFGSETLKDFAFAMVIGLIVGCYSSIAVAMPLFSEWKSREKDNAKLIKKYGPEVRLFEFVMPQPAEAVAEAPAAETAVVAAPAPAAPTQQKQQKWQPKKKKK
ncbi:MAG: protein translocase subunit SecD [Eggerthellales bacterium]|nr:protein translocase subunit SecD [Eggerthellales bacterium]